MRRSETAATARSAEFVQQKSSREHAREDFAIRKRKGFPDYGVGDAVVVVVSVVVDVEVSGVALAVVVVVVLSEVLDDPPAGDGFTTVVLFSVLFSAGEAAGAVVSVRCSQAAKSAAPARMQMYFFIIVKDWMGPYCAKG